MSDLEKELLALSEDAFLAKWKDLTVGEKLSLSKDLRDFAKEALSTSVAVAREAEASRASSSGASGEAPKERKGRTDLPARSDASHKRTLKERERKLRKQLASENDDEKKKVLLDKIKEAREKREADKAARGVTAEAPKGASPEAQGAASKPPAAVPPKGGPSQAPGQGKPKASSAASEGKGKKPLPRGSAL